MGTSPGTTRRRRRRTTERPQDVAVAYLRVSTEEQVKSGAGLGGQRAAIEAYASLRDWQIPPENWFIDEGISGTVSPWERPQLFAALEALSHGQAAILLFHRPDRLARKAADLLALRDRAEKEGWALVSSDGSVDLTTPGGRMMFTMLGGIAEMERDLISQRTREALAARQSAGVRLGRPPKLPDEVVARILRERAQGSTWQNIADRLNDEQVPTAHAGARWWPATVLKVSKSQDAARIANGEQQ